MTIAELIAELASVPEEAEVRVWVEESLQQREHNDQLDVAFVDTYYATGRGRAASLYPFVILHLKEAAD
jgi:hypothetical protein